MATKDKMCRVKRNRTKILNDMNWPQQNLVSQKKMKMALLLLNDFTPIREMCNAIYKETKLESAFIYQGIDYTHSDNDFYKVRIRHGKNIRLINRIEQQADFYISDEHTTISEIQNFVFETFGFEINFSKNRILLNQHEKLCLYLENDNNIDFNKIEVLNTKLITTLNDIYQEMQECILYFKDRKMKSSTIKDLEIDIEMNFIISKEDPLSKEDFDNFVYRLNPFVNSDDLNQFQDWYLNWDDTLFYNKLNLPPCTKPNRILFELHQKMGLDDLQRIENIWVDVKYVTQRF